MTSQESEYFFEHIKDAITALILGCQRPDSKRMLKLVQRSAATNIDQDYIDQILQEMVTNNLIYNKPTECGPSYYVTGKNGDSNVDANNTDNQECMTNNDPDEPGALHAIVTPNNKRDERPENLDKTPLQSQCFMSLKEEFLTLTNFVIGEINKISEKLKTSTHPNNEHALCQEHIKYLRGENNSKNLIIKILSENQNTFNGCLPQQLKSYEPYYDSNVPYIDPKKTVKYHKKKYTPHNFLSPNRFSTLDFNNDVMIMENNSYDKDPGNYTKENTDKRQNSINMTNGNRKSNIRPSKCTTEKYLQNHIHQQRIVPGNYSYSNATRHQKRKAVLISDNHLNRISKSRFKNDNIEHAVYFKCFSGSNSKQLNYYANPT